MSSPQRVTGLSAATVQNRMSTAVVIACASWDAVKNTAILFSLSSANYSLRRVWEGWERGGGAGDGRPDQREPDDAPARGDDGVGAAVDRPRRVEPKREVRDRC